MSLPGVAVLAALSAVATATACVIQLPPAATPEARAPAVQAAAPPEAGHGRLVVDVVDGPTPVHQIRMEPRQVDDGQGRTRVQFFESSEMLCQATPCITDPLTGNLLLGFPVLGEASAMEIELVNVGSEPTVYRRALSRHTDKKKGSTWVLGVIAASLGASSAITGVALLPVGLADDNRGLTIAGGITLGAGAIILAAGILAIRSESPTYRPGSANHFPVSP